MPATFTRHPVEPERKDPGIGGKPPVDRRPTGGGGGDENWDSRQSRPSRPARTAHPLSHGGALRPRRRLRVLRRPGQRLLRPPELRPHRRRRQRHLRLASSRARRPSSGSTPRSSCSPPSPWKSPAAISSAKSTSWKSGSASARPAVRRAAPWLIATIVLGSLFLAGQWIAWQQLAQQGFFFSSNPNSHFFYLVTGTHAVHLVLGIGAPHLRARRHVPLQARRDAPDRRRLHRLVLARHGRLLDLPLRRSLCSSNRRGCRLRVTGLRG